MSSQWIIELHLTDFLLLNNKFEETRAMTINGVMALSHSSQGTADR